MSSKKRSLLLFCEMCQNQRPLWGCCGETKRRPTFWRVVLCLALLGKTWHERNPSARSIFLGGGGRLDLFPSFLGSVPKAVAWLEGWGGEGLGKANVLGFRVSKRTGVTWSGRLNSAPARRSRPWGSESASAPPRPGRLRLSGDVRVGGLLFVSMLVQTPGKCSKAPRRPKLAR